jgi:hypothetical protein
MDVDRDRERDPAMDISAQYKAQQEKLWRVQAIDPKVWRVLTFEEKAAYQRLRDAYKEEENSVPLSVFATETLVPGTESKRTEPYVKTYVRGVKELAKFVASVDNHRRTFVETEFTEFLATLSTEQQAAARPMYDRLIDAMSPSAHLHRVVVDQSEFAHQN